MKKLEKLLKERLSTVEAAYNETGRPKVDFSGYPEDMRVHEEADYQAKVLVEAARKIERECGLGEMDWSDYSQPKYAPWFRMTPAAYAFCHSVCAYAYARAGSSARLRVLSREASDHLGQTFLEIWEAVQLK